MSPSGSIMCIQNDFDTVVCSTHTVHLSCTNTNTVSKQNQNKVLHDPCHLGVPSVASKMISEPVVHSAQNMPLNCIKISTISKRTETSFYLSLIT
jgi:hypothetical protein